MKPIALLLALTLTGCTTTQPITVTAPCPKPIIPSEPHYPVQDLRKGDSPAMVMKAYVATVKGQHDYIQQLQSILDGYN
jgi:hypothetical protein